MSEIPTISYLSALKTCKFVTISYDDGTMTVPKYSRIIVFPKLGEPFRGYFIRDEGERLVIKVPDVTWVFEMEEFAILGIAGITLGGKIKKPKKTSLEGFSFYPEVTIMETRDSKNNEGGSKNGDD